MARYLIPSDATIKAVRSGDPRKRLTDGDGLYLLLFVKGGAHGWRLDYTFEGRRKTLSLGTYPSTTLAIARRKADAAREKVADGQDPSQERKAQRVVPPRPSRPRSGSNKVCHPSIRLKKWAASGSRSVVAAGRMAIRRRSSPGWRTTCFPTSAAHR
jgi:hypothetical protein